MSDFCLEMTKKKKVKEYLVCFGGQVLQAQTSEILPFQVNSPEQSQFRSVPLL